MIIILMELLKNGLNNLKRNKLCTNTTKAS